MKGQVLGDSFPQVKEQSALDYHLERFSAELQRLDNAISRLGTARYRLTGEVSARSPVDELTGPVSTFARLDNMLHELTLDRSALEDLAEFFEKSI